MNRTPLKRYAPIARRQFRQAITDKAALLGLSSNSILQLEIKGDFAIVAGRAFPRSFADQRAKIEKWIERDGFETVVDEVAYTWFNRLIAIRYMEVHDYLSHGLKVLGHAEGRNQPEILVRAEDVDFITLDPNKLAEVTELKIAGNRDEELYRLLLLEQCHELHRAMPFLFEPISDESELLLPDTLLQSDSIVSTLVSEIPEESWQEIEIIGWLYQFYISERKDEVIGKVVASADIPAATQLFTPNWIVKYMTQNSLGRTWMATYPDSPLRDSMEYFIEPAEQTEEVQATLRAQTPSTLNPEELTLLDPACGSGHILVEAYELFKAMYLERGYRLRDIPRLIMEKNLFGLDIDPRAAQMAGFAVLMKGRADDRRLLHEAPQVQIHAIRESDGLSASELAQALAPSVNFLEQSPLETDIANLVDFYEGARTFGSLLQVPVTLEPHLERIKDAIGENSDALLAIEAQKALTPLVVQTEVLARKYDCVVANPPYMGGKGMNAKLKAFTSKQYPRSKADLFAVFIERNLDLCKSGGSCAMITMQSWMFLSSYSALRLHLFETKTLESMAHLGARAFTEISGEIVQTTSFVLRNFLFKNYRPTFIRATEGDEAKKSRVLRGVDNRFNNIEQAAFDRIPGSPLAYWASPNIHSCFEHQKLRSISISEGQNKTADNNKFVRFHWEINSSTVGIENKWLPYAKGGDFRKWYGNMDYVIDWSQPARAHYRANPSCRIIPSYLWFKPGVTWTLLTSTTQSFRLLPAGSTFDMTGSSIFLKDENHIAYVLCLLNSCVASYIFKLLNPTLALQVQNVRDVPIIFPEDLVKVNNIGSSLIQMSKSDWDAFETSWDFTRSPLLNSNLLECAFERWKSETSLHRTQIRQLEIENNRLFIAAYGLEDEFSPDVPEEQITIARADLEGDIKRLISYAIGCLMGRYSLDEDGLVFAGSGGEGFDPTRYKSLPADADGILPTTDLHWFDDDMVLRLGDFLRAAYGPEKFEENLTYLAQSLNPRAGETSEETLRRYLVSDFYKDHLRTYRNRPIYWLFSSGKEKAFGALVYLHRFNAGTLARMRSEYVLPLMGRYNARISQLELDAQSLATPAAKRNADKERVKRQSQLTELQRFDEKLRHIADQPFSLDLDDGVKVNYGKFADLLAEVRLVTGGSGE